MMDSDDSFQNFFDILDHDIDIDKQSSLSEGTLKVVEQNEEELRNKEKMYNKVQEFEDLLRIGCDQCDDEIVIQPSNIPFEGENGNKFLSEADDKESLKNGLGNQEKPRAVQKVVGYKQVKQPSASRKRKLYEEKPLPNPIDEVKRTNAIKAKKNRDKNKEKMNDILSKNADYVNTIDKLKNKLKRKESQIELLQKDLEISNLRYEIFVKESEKIIILNNPDKR